MKTILALFIALSLVACAKKNPTNPTGDSTNQAAVHTVKPEAPAPMQDTVLPKKCKAIANAVSIALLQPSPTTIISISPNALNGQSELSQTAPSAPIDPATAYALGNQTTKAIIVIIEPKVTVPTPGATGSK